MGTKALLWSFVVAVLLAGCMSVRPACAAGADSAAAKQAKQLDLQALAALRRKSVKAAASAGHDALLACLACPRSIDAWLVRGYVAAHSGSLNDARRFFMRGLEIGPRNAVVFDDLAVTAWREKNRPLACNYFLRALRTGPLARDTADNIFSFLQRVDATRGRFLTLKHQFALADKVLQEKMAARGLVRQGVNWISAQQAPVVAYWDRDYETTRRNLEARFSTDRRQLRSEARAIRRARNAVTGYYNQLRVTGQDMNNTFAIQQALGQAQMVESSDLQSRGATLADMNNLRSQAASLIKSPIGQVYNRRLQLSLPNALRPALGTENSANSLPDAPIVPGQFQPTAIGMLADRATMTNQSGWKLPSHSDIQIATVGNSRADVGEAPGKAMDAPQVKVQPAWITTAVLRRRTDIAAAKLLLKRAAATCRNSLLKSDRQEMRELQAATQAAMKARNVSGVVESQRVLRQVRTDYNVCLTDPLIADLAAKNSLVQPTDVAVQRIVKRRAKRVAVALGLRKQAGATYHAAIIDADKAEMSRIQAAIQNAMKSNDVNGVLAGARALKAAKAQLASDQSASGVVQAATGSHAVSFIGRGCKASRIVYIVNHAGVMLGNFGFMERKLDDSINRLGINQSFAVIIFRKRFHLLGPSAQTGNLLPATRPVKREVRAAIKRLQPQGPNAYRLRYFLKPFQVAFRMHPQVIYFLTNGSFDPELINRIRQLNRGKKVMIFTYAFYNHDPIFNARLKKIAAENRGQYKLVTR